jgi:hypothetical protein
MTSTRSWIAATLTAASLGFGWPSAGLAQDKPKDEGLEKLLEKLEDKDKDKDRPTPDKPADKEKDAIPGKAKAPDAGKVAPKDQELDKLLEGLGQTKDTPAPDDKKPGGAGPEDPSPPRPDKPRPDDLKGGEKDLDKELERITGKKEKPKDKRDRKGEEDGPLGNVIKEMRDVEERLGKPDTGEETRKKQTEIVKNLDDLIERMKNAPSQAQGLKMIREGKKPGQPQPGQPGNQPGAMANGPPPTRPTDPKKGQLPTELAKSIWGQLPAQFRDEMGNVLNEHPLPTRADLIKLYYLSLGNKDSNREE